MTYPIQAALRARELYAAGWKPTKIRMLLVSEGHGSPSVSTIREWVDPVYRERNRDRATDRNTRVAAERASFRLPGRSPQYQRAFMLELRSRGTPVATIARVCEIVFGVRYSREQIRAMLHDDEARVVA